jgi:ABC-type polar amino acid transport system ATPase subunit
MRVERGQTVVIIGPSGSGKSTFLRCLNHLETINAGRIYIEGEMIGYTERPDGSLLGHCTVERLRGSVPRSAWCFSGSTSSTR